MGDLQVILRPARGDVGASWGRLWAFERRLGDVLEFLLCISKQKVCSVIHNEITVRVLDELVELLLQVLDPRSKPFSTKPEFRASSDNKREKINHSDSHPVVAGTQRNPGP